MSLVSRRAAASVVLALIAFRARATFAQDACESAAATLENEAAPPPSRVLAAQALAVCREGLGRQRAADALLRQLFASNASVRRAVRTTIEQLSLASAAAIAALPPLDVLDRRARRFVDARFHDPNVTVTIVEQWRQRHVCNALLDDGHVVVRCGTVRDDGMGSRHHFSVDFTLTSSALGPPRLRQLDTADGSS